MPDLLIIRFAYLIVVETEPARFLIFTRKSRASVQFLVSAIDTNTSNPKLFFIVFAFDGVVQAFAAFIVAAGVVVAFLNLFVAAAAALINCADAAFLVVLASLCVIDALTAFSGIQARCIETGCHVLILAIRADEHLRSAIAFDTFGIIIDTFTAFGIPGAGGILAVVGMLKLSVDAGQNLCCRAVGNAFGLAIQARTAFIAGIARYI